MRVAACPDVCPADRMHPSCSRIMPLVYWWLRKRSRRDLSGAWNRVQPSNSEHTSIVRRTGLATPHELDDLNLIHVAEWSFIPVPAAYNPVIQLHGDPVLPDTKKLEKLANVCKQRNRTGFPVYFQHHTVFHFDMIPQKRNALRHPPG